MKKQELRTTTKKREKTMVKRWWRREWWGHEAVNRWGTDTDITIEFGKCGCGWGTTGSGGPKIMETYQSFKWMILLAVLKALRPQQESHCSWLKMNRTGSLRQHRIIIKLGPWDCYITLPGIMKYKRWDFPPRSFFFFFPHLPAAQHRCETKPPVSPSLRAMFPSKYGFKHPKQPCILNW